MKLTFTRNLFKYGILAAMLAISTVTYTNQNSPGPGLTGAPGDGNCTSCHSGSPITTGTAHDGITLTGLPVGGYAPGATYTLTYSGGSAATSKNGFQLLPLSSTNAMAGSFTAGTGQIAMVSGSKTYIGHTVSGTSSTSWSFSWTAPNPAVGTVTFYTTLNATNSSNGTTGDVVYLKSFTVTSGNLPVATITSPANNAIFCAGDSIQFTGTATNNPTSYAWDFLGNTPSSSSLQNPKILFNNPGFFTIRFRATNSSGTSTNAQRTIQVVAKPTASITPASSVSICGGDSVTLSATAGTGLTYLWSPGNQTTKDIKIANAGTYSVKVTNSNGCFRVSPNTVATINTKPAAPGIICNDSICVSDSLEISTAGIFSQYKYYINGNELFSSPKNTVKVFLQPGTFQIGVSGFNGTCNSEISSKQVYVGAKNVAPTLTCGTATSNSVSFNIAGNLVQLSIDSGKTWFSPNGTITHVLTGLSANQSVYAMARSQQPAPCLYSMVSNKTCVASSCQPIVYSIQKPTHVCLAGPGGIQQKSALIKLRNISGQNTFIKFGPQAYSKNDSIFLPIVPGNNNLLIKVIDSANASCGSKDSTITILGVGPIDPLPQIDQNIVPACSNGKLSIILSFPGNTTFIAQYYKDADSVPFVERTRGQGFSLANIPIDLFGFKNGTTLKVKVVDSIHNCPTYSLNEMLAIVFPAPAKMQVFKENLKVELRDTGASASRTWLFGDGNTAQNTPRIQNHTYATAGSYNVVLKTTDSNGCIDSATTSIQIVSTGLNQIAEVTGLELYPNPSIGSVFVTYTSSEMAKVSVFDIQGKVVLITQITSGDKLNLENLDQGVYTLQVNVANQSTTRKIILNKY